MLSLAVFLVILVALPARAGVRALDRPHQRVHLERLRYHHRQRQEGPGADAPAVPASSSGSPRSGRPGTCTTTSSEPTARDATSTVRLLYGGRNSLFIGLSSARDRAACSPPSSGSSPATSGGVLDAVLRALLDVSGRSRSTCSRSHCRVVLLTSGGSSSGRSASTARVRLPAHPHHRGHLRAVHRATPAWTGAELRGREFIVAGIGLGASDARILRKDVLPNVMPTVLVFLPLMTAIEHAHRVGPLVPVDRRPAAGRELGHDHQRRLGCSTRDRWWRCARSAHRDHRRRAQHLRRRWPRTRSTRRLRLRGAA